MQFKGSFEVLEEKDNVKKQSDRKCMAFVSIRAQVPRIPLEINPNFINDGRSGQRIWRSRPHHSKSQQTMLYLLW